MNIYKAFKTSDDAERNGTWVSMSPTCRLKIARSGNPRHKAAIERLSTPYIKPGMTAKDIPDETWQPISIEAAAETLLLDWEGVQMGEDDHPLPYSKQAAMELLGIKDFREQFHGWTTSLEFFRESRIAGLEKNS